MIPFLLTYTTLISTKDGQVLLDIEMGISCFQYWQEDWIKEFLKRNWFYNSGKSLTGFVEDEPEL